MRKEGAERDVNVGADRGRHTGLPSPHRPAVADVPAVDPRLLVVLGEHLHMDREGAGPRLLLLFMLSMLLFMLLMLFWGRGLMRNAVKGQTSTFKGSGGRTSLSCFLSPTPPRPVDNYHKHQQQHQDSHPAGVQRTLSFPASSALAATDVSAAIRRRHAW